MGYCFPHYFVLPMYSSASSYRFRPLGPEETLMEIWSLTRFPEGERAGAARAARGVGVRRSTVAADPRAGLLEPARGSSGACTPGASSTCGCPSGLEGHISNFERTIDGFLAGLPYERLLPALHVVNVNPLERPIVDIGF